MGFKDMKLEQKRMKFLKPKLVRLLLEQLYHVKFNIIDVHSFLYLKQLSITLGSAERKWVHLTIIYIKIRNIIFIYRYYAKNYTMCKVIFENFQ